MMNIRSLKASGYGYRPYKGYDQWGCYYNDYKAPKKTKTITLNYDEELEITRSYIDFNELYLLPDDQIPGYILRKQSGLYDINKNIGITRKLIITPRNWYLFKYRKVKRKEYYQNAKVVIIDNGAKGLLTIKKFKSYLTKQERNERKQDIDERVLFMNNMRHTDTVNDDDKIRRKFKSAWKLYNIDKECPRLYEFMEQCKHEKWYDGYIALED